MAVGTVESGGVFVFDEVGFVRECFVTFFTFVEGHIDGVLDLSPLFGALVEFLAVFLA